MDMQKYKEKMDSIQVKCFTIDELTNRQRKKKRQHISFSFAATAAVLLFMMTVLIPGSPQQNPLIISVYADDGNTIILSEKPITYQVNADMKYASNEVGKTKALINMALNFKIQGENIDKIKIICGEDETTTKDLRQTDIYFVEHLTVKKGEVDWLSLRKNERFVSSLTDDNETFITMLVGHSYELEYEQQDIGSYGLILPGTVNEANTYSVDETLLTLRIRYNDGSVVEKKVRISASDDVFSGIDIGLVS